jgi:3-methyladenine DNA glycosylase/8-oxoguanine DNA glycosylase
LSDAEATAALVAIKGVGRWTAETFLMFCEARTDVFPGGRYRPAGGDALGRRGRASAE